MKIGSIRLGEKPYIIAEAGVNHNGSLRRAYHLIDAAARAGADAIKFQTYTADELVVRGAPKFWDWEGDKHHKTQYDAYNAIGGFPYEYYPKLIKRCQEKGIEFLSTPFSIEAADVLNDMGMAAFKVASSDMSTLPFLEHIAKYNKPILLSTGAATLAEVKESVKAIEHQGNDQIVVMQCTLKYPTPNEHANFSVLHTYQKEFFGKVIGLSDHTLGAQTSVIGCAMGADVIEKHFTIDKTLGESADHWLSVDEAELSEIVKGCELVHTLRGNSEKLVSGIEKETRMYDKRSIVSAEDIPVGRRIKRDMLTFKRPGTGFPPADIEKFIGKMVYKPIKADEIISWDHFQKR